MNFSKILSKSFENVKRFKYLWGLGILAMLTQAGSGFNGYSFNSPSLEQKEIPDVNISRFTGWIQAHAAEVIVLAVIMLIIAIVLVYLSLRAQAGQIVAIAQIEKDKPIKNFKAAFSAGRGFAWELFWLSTLSFAIFILFIAITFVLPAALMVEIQATIVYVFGGLLIFLGFVGGFILLVWLAVGVQLGQREIVLKDKGILYSLEEGMRLAKHCAP